MGVKKVVDKPIFRQEGSQMEKKKEFVTKFPVCLLTSTQKANE